jgi:hypothetical protein
MVKRDPEYFWPSVHSIQQKKARGIGWDDVSETIQHGEAKPTHKENVWLYIHDCGYQKLVGVVASNDNGEILTIEFRK